MTNLSKGTFRGRFEIKLDPKGRMSLPSSYRSVMIGASSEFSNELGLTEVVITNSRFQNRSCLHVYTMSEWEKLERKIAKLSSLKTEVQAFSRFYLAGGQTVEVDSQGRILVPASLRRFAGLESQVVLIGMGSKFEIWSQNDWNSIYESLSENFESTMAAVADLDLDGEGV